MILGLNDILPTYKIEFLFFIFPPFPKEMVEDDFHFVMKSGRGLQKRELV